MKKLYLVRHAKSSWDDEGMRDFDRPLNDRGKKDAPKAGKRLKRLHAHPDLMLSSPAVRALSTCVEIAAALDYPAGKIKTEQRLYHAGPEEFRSVIRDVDDEITSLMIFGHNPGITEFANKLVGFVTDNIPTSGVVACELEITSWKQLKWNCGKSDFFDFPKKD